MIRQIRKHYNISQPALAGLLGVARSYISMAEGGHRMPSGKHISILTKFFEAIPKAVNGTENKEADELSFKQDPEVKKLAVWQLRRANYKLGRLQEKLAAMRDDQQRCLAVLNSLPQLAATAATKGEKLFIPVLEIDTREQLKKTGEKAQFKLTMAISRLTGEIAYLKNIAG